MPGIVPLTGGPGPAGSTAPALAAGAAATASPGGLTALIQGIQLPRRPDNFESLPAAQKKWIVDVEEYLRRLMAKLGQVTSTIDQIMAEGVADNRYNAATHTFQSKYFQKDGSAGPWTDWSGDQPVQLPEVVEEIGVTDGAISDLRVSNVYVLEKGSESTGMIGCKCGSGGASNNCWSKWTSTYSDGWSAPTLVQHYCGTPPPSVAVNKWVFTDQSNAFFWQQGESCQNDADCVSSPPPPPPVNICGAPTANTPPAVKVNYVRDDGMGIGYLSPPLIVTQDNGLSYTWQLNGFDQHTVHVFCSGQGWIFAWILNGETIEQLALTVNPPSDDSPIGASGSGDAGDGHILTISIEAVP